MDSHHRSNSSISFPLGFSPTHPQPAHFLTAAPTTRDGRRHSSALVTATSANTRAAVTSNAKKATSPTAAAYLQSLASVGGSQQLLMQPSLPPLSQLLPPPQQAPHTPESATVTSDVNTADNQLQTAVAAAVASSGVLMPASTVYYDYAAVAVAATHGHQMEAAMNEVAAAAAAAAVAAEYHHAAARAAVVAAAAEGGNSGGAGGGYRSLDNNIRATAGGDIMTVETGGGDPQSSSSSGLAKGSRRRIRHESISSAISDKVYSFVAIPGNNAKKRPRRRHDEIERLYQCNWPGCSKAYGTLNHLNAHVSMQKHGPKRHPAEFKEMRKEWRRQKKEREATESTTGNNVHHQQIYKHQSMNHHYQHLHQAAEPSALSLTFEPTSFNFSMEQPLTLSYY